MNTSLLMSKAALKMTPLRKMLAMPRCTKISRYKTPRSLYVRISMLLHTQTVVACKQTFIISAAVQAFLHLQVSLKVLAKAS